MSKITVTTLKASKQQGQRFACLTAYDATQAALLDSAGIEVVLVGDSLGMVIQGRNSTVPVSMDDMVYHSRCVSQGLASALLLVDMPFMSYATTEQALLNAARLMQQGNAEMVKLEGGRLQAEVVTALTQRGMPVCAHLGLTPQSVHKLGGYRVQGTAEHARQQMLEDALILQDAGADLMVLECVPTALAGEITANLEIPVIGIGAGNVTDAQVLVLYDMLGLTAGRVPRFVRNFAQQASVADAVRAYRDAVLAGEFPAAEHTFA